MKIIRISANIMGKPEISGSTLTVYHRTKSEELGGSICSIGFIAGSGAAYGTGIYTTYTYESSTRNSNMGAYGTYIVKGEVDIYGFLILDYELAQQIYGANYKLSDQLKRVVGEDKVINSSLGVTNQLNQIEQWSKELEGIQWSSDIASSLSRKYGLDKTGLKGIIFTGRNDGNVCLVFVPMLVTPLEFAKVDGATYQNPVWQSCPQGNIDEMRAMREDSAKMETFASARMDLLSDIKNNKGKPVIDIRKENHPDISDNIFDQFITNILWEDESRINKLTPPLRARLGDVIAADLLIRKMTRNPKVHWEEWKKQPQEVRDKVSHEMITEIWEDWLAKRPGHWKMLPEDVKGSISKKGEGEYWAAAVKKNPANWRYVPAEVAEYMIDNKESLQITKIPTDEEFVDHKKKLKEVELEETEAFEIPEDSVEWVQTEVGKMNRKAQKLGLPDIVVDDIGDNKATNTRTVKIIGNVPSIKGVKILARITKYYDKEEDGMVTEVDPLTDEAFPQENWDANPIRCDHCSHKKTGKSARKMGYIVKNENAEDPTKQYQMIGSSCIDDFITDLPGKNSYSKDQIKGIANYAYKFKQMVVMFQEGNQFANKTAQQIRTSFKSGGVPILFFMSRASFLARTQGFVSGKYGTGRMAYNMSIDGAIDKPDDITAQDISYATNAIEWINNKKVPQPADGDKKSFMWDLKQAASSPKVKSKTSSLIGWLINMYLKNKPQKDEAKILGSDGQVITFKGQLVMKNPVFVAIRRVAGKNKNISNDFCVAENSNGMRVVWSSVDNVPKKIGDGIIVTGIINGTATVGGHTATALKDVREIPEDQFLADKGRMDKQTQDFQNKSGGRGRGNASTGQYGHGDIVDEDFIIVRVDPRDYRGSKRYTVSPVGNPKSQMSSFVKSPIGNVGDTVKLRGKIEVNGKYTNLVIAPNVGVSAPQAQPKQQPQQKAIPQRQYPPKVVPTSYSDGDKVEDDFKIIRVDKANYGSLRYTLINRSRVQLSSFIKGPVGNVGDVVRLSGTIKIKGIYTNIIVNRVLPKQQPANTPPQTPPPSNPTQVTPQGPVANNPPQSSQTAAPATPVAPTASDDINRMIESSRLTWFEKQRVFAGLQDFMPWLNKKEDPSKITDNTQTDDSANDSDGDQRKFKYPDEINLTDAYGRFKDSYEKTTGKSWTEEKFKGRAAGWIFYGDGNGYIAIRPQRSGLYKLVGVAGNEDNPREKIRSIRNAFSDLTSEGKPVWGMVSSDIKGLLEKHGFTSPSALAIKALIKAIPSGVLGGADVKKILPDGGVELEYSDVGSATKYFVANKEYYGWLRGEVKNNPKIPNPAKFIIEKAIGSMAKVLGRTRIFKIASACDIPSFISVEDV